MHSDFDERIDREQRLYHEMLMRRELMRECGVQEEAVAYRVSDDVQRSFLDEMIYWYKKGARITVNGRDLMPREFSPAAGLLAGGLYHRDIVPGDTLRDTEFRLIPKTYT